MARRLTEIVQASNRQAKTITKNDYLGVFLLGTVGLQVVVLFFQFVIFVQLKGVNDRPHPGYLAVADGGVQRLLTLAGNDRPLPMVKTFVTDRLTELFTWRATLPPKTVAEFIAPKPDPGIKLGSSDDLRLPTSVWQAGFTLSDDFRESFLKTLAEIVRNRGVFDRSTQVALVVSHVSEPQLIESGKWKVVVVGRQVVVNSDSAAGIAIPFAKEVYVRVIPIPVDKSFSALTPITEDLSSVIAKARSWGLEIYGLRDYEPKAPTK